MERLKRAAVAALLKFLKRFRRELYVLVGIYLLWVLIYGPECGFWNTLLSETGAMCPVAD